MYFQLELLQQRYSDEIKKVVKEKEEICKAHQETLKSFQLLQNENSRLKAIVRELHSQNAEQLKMSIENMRDEIMAPNKSIQEENMVHTTENNLVQNFNESEDLSAMKSIDKDIGQYTNLLSIGGAFAEKEFRYRELLVAIVVLEGENRDLKDLVEKLNKDLKQKGEEADKLAQMLDEITRLKIMSYAEQGEIAG